jgi:hypothetical protein
MRCWEDSLFTSSQRFVSLPIWEAFFLKAVALKGVGEGF